MEGVYIYYVRGISLVCGLHLVDEEQISGDRLQEDMKRQTACALIRPDFYQLSKCSMSDAPF